MGEFAGGFGGGFYIYDCNSGSIYIVGNHI